MEEAPQILDAHLRSFAEVIQVLQTDSLTGLTAIEAERRVKLFGDNVLEDTTKTNPIRLFLSHFFNVVTLILGAVLCVAVALRDWIEAGVVVAVIVSNGLIGFLQEYSSEKSLAALRKMAIGLATVQREGQQHSVPLEQLVVGDIVLLKQGDLVPADLRIVRSERLEIDEALLTGETVPVSKTCDPLPKGEYSVGDLTNMAFRQTAVTTGKGVGVVVRTGMQTEIGKIALQLGAQKQVTTLHHKLTRVLYSLFGAGVLLAIVVFAVNKFKITKQVLLYASSLGIAILPEGLIAVVTVTLAAGTKKMAKRRAIVRRLAALETLGSITDIVSDKTGTLTEGKMAAVAMWLPSGRALDVDTRPMALQATFRNADSPEQVVSVPELVRDPSVVLAAMVASLCNSSNVLVAEGKFLAVGNPTEAALGVLGHQLCRNRRYFQDYLGFANVGEWPFDSTVKRMSVGYVRRSTDVGGESGEEFPLPTTGVEQLSGIHSFVGVKGAADVLLPLCRYFWSPSQAAGQPAPAPSLATSPSSQTTPLNPQVWKQKCEAEISLLHVHRQELTDEMRAEVERRVLSFASRGLRVLALAFTPDVPLLLEPLEVHRDVSEVRHVSLTDIPRADVERDLTFVGLVGIYDPPRQQSRPAVELCQRAGITVRMATGDHPETATAIARQLRILDDGSGSCSGSHVSIAMGPEPDLLTGPQIDALSLAELQQRDQLPHVVARCSPASKVKLVEALHARKRRVAMTGDGVNDAPAIKKADVGVAMGIAGSDVTKGAADITLTDDDFSTLVTAIAEGRRIFSNIQKFLIHLLSGNIAEVIVLVIGLAFRDSEGNAIFPMSPIEILWLNMATSSPPAIALGLDKASPSVMDQPPHSGKLFTKEVLADTFVYGSVMGVLSLCSFVLVVYGFGKGNTGIECHYYTAECAISLSGRTTAFAVLYILLLLLTYVCRDPRLSIFRRDIFDNKWINICVPIAVAILFPLIYVKVISRTIFQHNLISWEWSIIAVNSFIFLIVSELYKFCKRRFCCTEKIVSN